MHNLDDQAALASALKRQDFLAFAEAVFYELEPGVAFHPSWYHEAIGYHLARAGQRAVRRLIVNLPPRSGKSLIVSVAWPLFLLGHDPTLRIICVSHTEELAREFSRKRSVIVQSAWYQALFPNMRLSRLRDVEIVTADHGSCLAVGVGGAILGKGADFIIVDDPLKGIDALSKLGRQRVNDFWDNILITRLNDKQSGVIVVVMQRLHEDDLVGHIEARGGWDKVSFPAIADEPSVHPLSDTPGDVYRRQPGEVLDPVREPLSVLEEMRRAQGSLLFNSQYLQRPLPAGGNVIRRDWLRYYDLPPERFDRVVVSWDTASTTSPDNDWCVGTAWGAVQLDYYLLDVRRARLEAPDLRRAIMEFSNQYDAHATLMEDTALGKALVQDLHRTGGLRLILQVPHFDKETRLLAQSARFEAGQVHLPVEAPWLATYLDELLAFPNSRHDDQVDSTSQALSWLSARTPAERVTVRRKIEHRRRIRPSET